MGGARQLIGARQCGNFAALCISTASNYITLNNINSIAGN